MTDLDPVARRRLYFARALSEAPFLLGGGAVERRTYSGPKGASAAALVIHWDRLLATFGAEHVLFWQFMLLEEAAFAKHCPVLQDRLSHFRPELFAQSPTFLCARLPSPSPLCQESYTDLLARTSVWLSPQHGNGVRRVAQEWARHFENESLSWRATTQVRDLASDRPGMTAYMDADALAALSRQWDSSYEEPAPPHSTRALPPLCLRARAFLLAALNYELRGAVRHSTSRYVLMRPASMLESASALKISLPFRTPEEGLTWLAAHGRAARAGVAAAELARLRLPANAPDEWVALHADSLRTPLIRESATTAAHLKAAARAARVGKVTTLGVPPFLQPHFTGETFEVIRGRRRAWVHEATFTAIGWEDLSRKYLQHVYGQQPAHVAHWTRKQRADRKLKSSVKSVHGRRFVDLGIYFELEVLPAEVVVWLKSTLSLGDAAVFPTVWRRERAAEDRIARRLQGERVRLAMPFTPEDDALLTPLAARRRVALADWERVQKAMPQHALYRLKARVLLLRELRWRSAAPGLAHDPVEVRRVLGRDAKKYEAVLPPRPPAGAGSLGGSRAD